jgi:hypothetical protein
VAFVKHYTEGISIINKLEFVNARKSSDSVELINAIHNEAKYVVDLIKNPDELDRTRDHFSYRGHRPRTT